MEDVVGGCRQRMTEQNSLGLAVGPFPTMEVSPSQPRGNYRFSQFPVRLWVWGRRYSQTSEPEAGQGGG